MKRSLFHVALLACLFSGTAMAQVQVGSNANASASETTAVGDNAQAVTHLSTAIGARAVADGGTLIDGSHCVGATAVGNEATSQGCSTTSLGYMSQSNANGATAVGARAESLDINSSAFGTNASASSGNATAVGARAESSGQSSSAFGGAASASGIAGTAIGAFSKATGDVATAVGYDAQATGRGATSLGNNAQAQADYATAIGSDAVAQQNGTTVGTFSAAGSNAAALGYNAKATHTNSVAIGANTRTTGSNQVAMGYRQVTQVADGRVTQGSTDAVNGGQLWNLQKLVDDRWIETNRRLDRTDKRINGLGAQTAAMAQMAAAGGPYGLAVGEMAFNAGVGLYGNEAAIAVGWSSRVSERVNLSAGVSFGTGNTKAMGGVGLSIRFGR